MAEITASTGAALSDKSAGAIAAGHMHGIVERIAELEDALRRVVRDVSDYEEANQLSPNPGRTECWDSVAHAKAVLANRQ
jgi:hypothetical protein